MLIAVAVLEAIAAGNQIRIRYMASMNQGHQVGGDTVIDVAAAATIINTAIINAAKAQLTEVFGINIPGNATIKLFGGAV